MEIINEWFKVNIETAMLDGIHKLNYYVYKIEWLIIILGVIIAAYFFIINIRNYSYKYELSKSLKASLFIVAASYLIRILNISEINSIFDAIFYNFMPLTILIIILGYVFDKFVFYKFTKRISTEIIYLNYIIYIAYAFLLISGIYELKDIILPFIWQINLISTKFWLENKESDDKIDPSRELYKTRKQQLNILKEMIRDNKYDNYAIAITGEWGSGKSNLISSLVKECNNDNNYCINIKPMISDTQKSLAEEFRKQISILMTCNGIYSGRNSSLDRYFKEILKLIQFNDNLTLSSFINSTKDNISHKDLQSELQKDIDSLLNKGDISNSKRLIVVIDDFDRVNEDKQMEILSFIKEVIDFEGCITVFALDYRNLKNNITVTPLYLEKFIATQIPLVDITFDEIIEFHVEYILDEKKIENKFSKKILQELRDNICNYCNNIDSRIQEYYIKRNDDINKSKDDKDKKSSNSDELRKFLSFSIDKSKYINNSRRVIHFLNELQNTVVLIDKLYDDRNDGEKLLNQIKTSEIIYFFNYIKVFYKEAYESLINCKGIEEYYYELDKNEDKLEKNYFATILGDIVPSNTFISEIINDEGKKLNRTNTFNLIKDLFINYHFTKNKIELLTNSEKYIDEIDENNICIDDNYSETLQVYQSAIFKHSKNEQEKIKRIEKLVDYVVIIYNKGKIEFLTLLELASYTSNRAMEYAKCYLEEACRIIINNNVKISSSDKNNIHLILSNIEIDNIHQFKYAFIELLNIASLNTGNNNHNVHELFGSVTKTDKLYEIINDYVTRTGLIDYQKDISDIKKVISQLFDQIKTREYTVLDLELLSQRLNQFLINDEYIKKLNQINVTDNTLSSYKYLSDYNNIKDIDEVKTILKNLSKEQTIDSNMMRSFQNITRFIINQNYIEELDDVYKSMLIMIFKKMKKEECWNEYAWFDIMINVERIVNL